MLFDFELNEGHRISFEIVKRNIENLKDSVEIMRGTPLMRELTRSQSGLTPILRSIRSLYANFDGFQQYLDSMRYVGKSSEFQRAEFMKYFPQILNKSERLEQNLHSFLDTHNIVFTGNTFINNRNVGRADSLSFESIEIEQENVERADLLSSESIDVIQENIKEESLENVEVGRNLSQESAPNCSNEKVDLNSSRNIYLQAEIPLKNISIKAFKNKSIHLSPILRTSYQRTFDGRNEFFLGIMQEINFNCSNSGQSKLQYGNRISFRYNNSNITL